MDRWGEVISISLTGSCYFLSLHSLDLVKRTSWPDQPFFPSECLARVGVNHLTSIRSRNRCVLWISNRRRRGPSCPVRSTKGSPLLLPFLSHLNPLSSSYKTFDISSPKLSTMHTATLLSVSLSVLGAMAQFCDPSQACCAQPFGSGPTGLSDTQFQQAGTFTAMAHSSPTPENYTAVYRSLNGAASQPNYMGLYVLQSYSPTQCGQYCSGASGCLGFNIYAERDPSLNPGPNCPDPSR